MITNHINKMSIYLTRESYIKKLQEVYDNTNISIDELICGIIKHFGNETNEDYIAYQDRDSFMYENDIEYILSLILGESKDMIMVICTNHNFSKKLNSYYNTKEGQGYICLNKEE